MSDSARLTTAGKIVVALVVLLCIGGGAWLFLQPSASSTSRTDGSALTSSPAGDQITVGIAYGTEKQRWLQWAVAEFAATPQGRRINIDLIPMGSQEGAHALLQGDQRIHVWSPASALYKDTFEQDWQLVHGKPPIMHEAALALTPMVFVTWKERLDAFEAGLGSMEFDTVLQALQMSGGWGGIANRPEWGYFKFGQTDPVKSNSGMTSLLLSAYHHKGALQGLTLADVVAPAYQDWVRPMAQSASGLRNSSGNLVREMVLKGPSTYDAVLVYENLAIDYLKNAEGRWGALAVTYPKLNIWNENPYYIIDAHWSSSAHQKAAQQFLDFLLSVPVQERALQHGFRPANPAVSITDSQSPFVQASSYGIQIDLNSICEPPSAEVISNLLTGWQPPPTLKKTPSTCS